MLNKIISTWDAWCCLGRFSWNVVISREKRDINVFYETILTENTSSLRNKIAEIDNFYVSIMQTMGSHT